MGLVEEGRPAERNEMKYEDVEMGRKVRVIRGRHKGKDGKIIDRWPPGEPTVILDVGGEYAISEVELTED